jgi:hypothetical protein
MELDQTLSPWVKLLEEAFRPYPEFIQHICTQLAELEKMAPRVEVAGVEPVRSQVKPLSDKSVLLVDQAEVSRVLVSHYFKGLPVKLEFALTEASARDKCESQSFDLILMGENLKTDFPKSIPLQTMLGTREERIEKLKQYLWA